MKRPWSSRLSRVGSNQGSRLAVLGAERQRGDPVRGTDGDVHRAGPVRPKLDGVGVDPALELRAELVEVAALPGQPVRGSEQRQVLEARELPRHLDVRAVAVRDRQQRDVASGQRRPLLKSALPVDLAAEVGRARAEEVEAVSEDGVCPLDASSRRSRARSARRSAAPRAPGPASASTAASARRAPRASFAGAARSGRTAAGPPARRPARALAAPRAGAARSLRVARERGSREARASNRQASARPATQ